MDSAPRRQAPPATPTAAGRSGAVAPRPVDTPQSAPPTPAAASGVGSGQPPAASQLTGAAAQLTEEQLRRVLVVWDYHLMHHELRRCDVAVGLGSFDLDVAVRCAELYHAGLFPTLLFTGGNTPLTAGRFPRGEAEHYREHAVSLGVPPEAVLVEPHATNTGENIAFSRRMLAAAGLRPRSVLLVAKLERRPYATARRQWPEVEPVCASYPRTLEEYTAAAGGNVSLVVDVLVGELQRIIEYPALGYTAHQPVPSEVHAAYEALRADGFTGYCQPLGDNGD